MIGNFTGKTGVYRLNYAKELITVRIMEAPEMMQDPHRDPAVYVALVTFMKDGVNHRNDVDVLTQSQKEHCVKWAMSQDPKMGDEFLSFVAQAYWRIIA
jgi:hypothetical protein